MNVAVVIPFFQRERGILLRAVRSVLAQELPADACLRILVVDDSSPIPAESELAGLAVPSPHAIEVVRQRNGGPGSARNRALDLLDPMQETFVSFLDSDDEWQPVHLQEALKALGDEHDYYFCDHTRFSAEASLFEASTTLALWKSGGPHPNPFDAECRDGLRILPPALAVQTLVNEYLSQTSTVVYRFARLFTLRFDESLRYAGEDTLFFIQLSANSRSVIFSEKKNVFCGRGINIYNSAHDWSEMETVRRYGYLVLFWSKLHVILGRNPAYGEIIAARVKRFSMIYAYLIARNILRGKLPESIVLRKIFSVAPTRVLALPFHLVAMLKTRSSTDWND